MSGTIRFRSHRVVVFLFAAGGLVLATGSVTPATGQAPSLGAEQMYRWTAPPSSVQLATDPISLTAGQGAILVPALSDGKDEPDVLVYQGDRQMAVGPVGRRILVAPGAYSVRVGSGPVSQLVTVPVSVAPGETALVPVEWGGLKIDVVDENNVPHRGSYELIRLEDRQPYTVGYGADTLQGERLRTILLPPGLYRIVRPGANYRARTDFATVVVPSGGLVHYKLVVDPDSGHFRGAGVVPPEEVGVVTGVSPWNRRYGIGVSLPFASNRNVVGSNNQTSVAADLFFDTYLTYREGPDFASAIVELEEGFLKLDPEGADAVPFQKTRDRLRIDGLYTRFTHPRVGPYGRVGVMTNLFETTALATNTTTVTRLLSDGTRRTEQVSANTSFRTGDAFAPILLREGAGLNTRMFQARDTHVDWRVGAGFRQNRFNDSFFLQDDPATPDLEYREAESFNQEGLETTLAATTRYRFLLLNTNLDLFGDFSELGEPTVDWRNTVSWRLTRNLSLDYVYDLLRLPQVSTRNQTRQNVLLRFGIGS